jgi:hypothetical protein
VIPIRSCRLPKGTVAPAKAERPPQGYPGCGDRPVSDSSPKVDPHRQPGMFAHRLPLKDAAQVLGISLGIGHPLLGPRAGLVGQGDPERPAGSGKKISEIFRDCELFGRGIALVEVKVSTIHKTIQNPTVMNTNTQSVLRTGLVALSLVLAQVSLAAAPSDPAALKLARYGSVPVESAGPAVQIGAPKEEVSLTIGSPSRILRDGRWIFFRNFWVDQSLAHGSLVVAFKDGKVSELRIVTPSEGIALCNAKRGAASTVLIAAR